MASCLQYCCVSGAFQYRYKLQAMTTEQCSKICGPDLSQGLLQPCWQHSGHIRYESALPFEQKHPGALSVVLWNTLIPFSIWGLKYTESLREKNIWYPSSEFHWSCCLFMKLFMFITAHSLPTGSLAGAWVALTQHADFSSCTQYCSLNNLTTLRPCAPPSTLPSYLLLLNAICFSLFVMLRRWWPELCRTPWGLPPSREVPTGPVPAAGEMVCISQPALRLPS